MCGIAGIATKDGLEEGDDRLADAMLRSLAHRGPDDQHVRATHRAIIGSRRLAIIDLAGGRQPLTEESGLITASQNGEIYNYVELREEMLRKGHRFATHSDTETIAHLYEEYGTSFASHLRGMFAIAIWDERRGRLVLARDRLGKKPLYWRLANGRLTYGSELKAILQDAAVERQIDRAALSMYLEYQYVPAPYSILEGVEKLRPASVLWWDGNEPTIEQYWTPRYEPKQARSFEEDVDEGLSIIREAVRLRLRSDVPVGSFLSGGMDSSIVTALMAEMSAEPVRTFSIGFEERAFDELPYARAVAQRYGTVHTEAIVRLDAIELLPALADHFDEPFADSSAIPTYRVAQLASEYLKVVLTGDGGDESFGGYLRYRSSAVADAVAGMPGPIVRAAARSAQRLSGPLGDDSTLRHRLGLAEDLAGLSRDERYLRSMTFLRPGERERLLGGRNGHDPSRYLLDVLAAGPTDRVDRLLRADLLTYLPEALLVKMDRATMANSLEARAPLLDHELVEFAARLPSDRKVAGSTTKVLLRAIAKRLLPAEHVDRPKMGFTLPVGEWFRGSLGDLYSDLVLASDARIRDHLDPAVAASLLVDHRHGGQRQDALWLLLMFELWARRWLTSPVAPA